MLIVARHVNSTLVCLQQLRCAYTTIDDIFSLISCIIPPLCDIASVVASPWLVVSDVSLPRVLAWCNRITSVGVHLDMTCITSELSADDISVNSDSASLLIEELHRVRAKALVQACRDGKLIALATACYDPVPSALCRVGGEIDSVYIEAGRSVISEWHGHSTVDNITPESDESPGNRARGVGNQSRLLRPIWQITQLVDLDWSTSVLFIRKPVDSVEADIPNADVGCFIYETEEDCQCCVVSLVRWGVWESEGMR